MQIGYVGAEYGLCRYTVRPSLEHVLGSLKIACNRVLSHRAYINPESCKRSDPKYSAFWLPYRSESVPSLPLESSFDSEICPVGNALHQVTRYQSVGSLLIHLSFFISLFRLRNRVSTDPTRSDVANWISQSDLNRFPKSHHPNFPRSQIFMS